MLQALSGPTACWAGLLCVPCWAVLRRGRRPAREPSGTLHTGNALHTCGASVRTLYVHSATCPGLVPLRSTPYPRAT